MNKVMSKIGKLVIVLALSIAMALTPVCAYAAPAQQTVSIDAVAVNNAIANKDYNYIISIFLALQG